MSIMPAAAFLTSIQSVSSAGAAAGTLRLTIQDPPDNNGLIEIIGRIFTAIGNILEMLPSGSIKLDAKSIIIALLKLAKIEELEAVIDGYVAKLLTVPKFAEDVWAGFLVLAVFAAFCLLAVSVPKYVSNYRIISREGNLDDLIAGNHEQLVPVEKEILRTIGTILLIAVVFVLTGWTYSTIMKGAASVALGFYDSTGNTSIATLMFQMVLRIIDGIGFWGFIITLIVFLPTFGFIQVLMLYRLLRLILEGYKLVIKLPAWATGNRNITVAHLTEDFFYRALSLALTTVFVLLIPLIIVELTELKGVLVAIAFGLCTVLAFLIPRIFAALITEILFFQGVVKVEGRITGSPLKPAYVLNPEAQQSQGPAYSEVSTPSEGTTQKRNVHERQLERYRNLAGATVIGAASALGYQTGKQTLEGIVSQIHDSDDRRALNMLNPDVLLNRAKLDPNPDINAQIFGYAVSMGSRMGHLSPKALAKDVQQSLNQMTQDNRDRTQAYGYQMLQRCDELGL